ncbi:MAG: 4Fe-4S dicluster domain-containing protein [Methanobrevibacter sp.]|jgi:succinate dehydrogenase / fumarate reductase iron-sulfur subunit|nr:4Fe-4S dicluster domain-containing protein [Candidatus Methanoflexus mossambicus]
MVVVNIKIKRTSFENDKENSYFQTFVYDGDINSSIAFVIEDINSRKDIIDVNGKKSSKINWECGCLQKKCGACGMIINGSPSLACSSFLMDFLDNNNSNNDKVNKNNNINNKNNNINNKNNNINNKNNNINNIDNVNNKNNKKNNNISKTITLEPLSKFPTVNDLIVNKKMVFDSLNEMKLYLESDAKLSKNQHESEYQSSRCLMCGCCLEVCPNFNLENDFNGALSMVNAFKLLIQEKDEKHKEKMMDEYNKHYYAHCGKSLSCNDICPMNIPIEELLNKSNAIAVWKRKID